MAICQGPVANLFFATGPFLAEMEGFEPPHALRRLPDFESGPFSHLGTSPSNPICPPHTGGQIQTLWGLR